jgi:hypothetical protein
MSKTGWRDPHKLDWCNFYREIKLWIRRNGTIVGVSRQRRMNFGISGVWPLQVLRPCRENNSRLAGLAFLFLFTSDINHFQFSIFGGIFNFLWLS